MKKILFFIFSLLITFTSCKEEEPLPISVESVKLNHSSITLVIGESDMLIATVSPNNAENKKVSWSSSDKKVATVINGEVTAIKEGVANIIVMTEDGGHTAKCVVTVKKETDKEDDSEDGEKDDENENDGEKIPVTGLSLDIESLSMTVGDEQILTATLYPSNASNKNILWNSSSPDVARVSNGKVTAVSVGTTEITATTEDGGHTATCIITVSPKVLWGIVGSMNEFGETELIMSENDYENYYVRRNVSMDMYDYFVFFNYDGSEEYYGTYSEDDFAPINNKISIVKEGFSFVVADAGTYDVFLDKSLKCCYIMENGNSPEDAIAIDGDDDGNDDTDDDDGDDGDDDGSIPVESISLDNESLSMVIGEEQILTATIYPSNATNCNIIWESSSPDVVSVDNGKVIALSVGSSEITAKTEDGGYTATCSIMVSSKTMWGLFGSVNDYGDTELIMSEDVYENYYVRRNVSMDMYDSFVFLNYNGSDEYYGSDTESDFVSINNKSAIVKEGYFFNVADAGTYDVFLAKSLDYCFVMETGEIPDDTEKVISVTGISLSKTSITLMEGNSTTLTATVIPSDASDKSVKWYSNNTSVAIVNNGEVTAIAEGNAIITVESNDGGYIATCNVTVTSQNSGDDSGCADPDDHTKISVKVNLQEYYDWSDDEWEEFLNKSYNSNHFVGFGANFKEIKYENGWLSICFDGDVTTIPDDTDILYSFSATSIVLPNSITYIGGRVFQDIKCSINIPESLVDIGELAFYNSGITDLILPETVISIGEHAFRGCTNLNYVSIPTSLDIIPYYCFAECIGLSEVTIPSSVKKIGESAFKGCNGLKMLTIGDNSTVATMEIDEDAFKDCSSLKNVEIGSEVEIIENDAFKGCNNLSKVSFGDNISSGTMKIGAGVFQNCSLLEEVIFGTEVSEIGVASFESCTSLESFTIPESVITIGTNAFKNCTNIKSVVIPGGVSSVGGSAFENCTSLQTLTIGNDDTSRGTSISENAFKNCTSLENTTLNKSVILNSRNVFESATGDIVINCNLDNCSGVFADSQFDSVTIGSDVNRIGERTFANMKFDIINIGDNVLEIGELAFMSAKGNTVLFTGNSKLNRIKGGGFTFCKINDLDLPESLVTIEQDAFSGASINNLTVGANVKGIGYGAFFETSGDITIKCDLSNISHDMYSEDIIHDMCFTGNYFTSIRIIGNYETLSNIFIGGNGVEGVEIMDKFIIEGTIKEIFATSINPKRLNELHLCKSIQSIYVLFNNLLTTTEVLNVYCAPPTPPTIYDDLPFSDNTKIYVPRNSVDDYKTDENWSKFADNIIGYDFK